MTNETIIRRRPDGSIDTAHFVAKGREERSQAAHSAAQAITKPSSVLASTLAGLLVLVLPHGGQS